MANIFIAFRSALTLEPNKTAIFYESLAKALSENGNNVLLWNEWLYSAASKDSTIQLKTPLQKERAIKKINKFAPDAVISFNNIIPSDIENTIHAPIGLYDADALYLFYNKERLLNKSYIYLASTRNSFNEYKKHCNAAQNTIHYVPAATALEAHTITQDKNITFIGTNFHGNHMQNIMHPSFYSVYSSNQALFKKARDILTENFLIDQTELNKELQKEFGAKKQTVDSICAFLLALIPKSQRLEYLRSIKDLGLSLYGGDVGSWLETFYYDLELGLCYRPGQHYTLKDNENLYNSSKICLNISHPQAVTGFSWRVQDIMASNACLLMDPKEDFTIMFGEYYDKEILEAISFRSSQELREKCIHLLTNEDLHRSAVEQSHKAITTAGRWEHRFPTLEEAFGIPLFNKNKGMGSVSVLTL
ncbi:MAG: glycosyltransferase family protein [Desulfovibrionaceae bacterium]